MRIHRVTIDTDHFHFEAYGATKREADEVMTLTLATHGVRYKLPPDWHEPYWGGREHFQFVVGEGFRDRELLVKK